MRRSNIYVGRASIIGTDGGGTGGSADGIPISRKCQSDSWAGSIQHKKGMKIVRPGQRTDGAVWRESQRHSYISLKVISDWFSWHTFFFQLKV